VKKLFILVILLLILQSTDYADAIEIEKLNKCQKIKVEITFYVPSAGGINCWGDPNKTAFGCKPNPKTIVAVSRSLLKKGIKKGTKIYIPNIGIRIVEDLMSPKITKDMIDVCLDSTKEAFKWGRINRHIYILSK